MAWVSLFCTIPFFSTISIHVIKVYYRDLSCQCFA
uniref:Uncharacterized protein n=1 Tax=Arundo donax TaxID=35708 RepID=A0A0A9FKU8_ARUDO